MKRVATWAAALAFLGTRANGEDNKEDEDDAYDSWRKMSTTGCISSDVASSGFIGYTVGEYWNGMDVDVSIDGLGQFVDNQTFVDYVQDGKHFELSYSLSELERIEACSGIRDMYLAATELTNDYNYTSMGWFLYIKEDDNPEESSFHCHLETYTEIDEETGEGGSMQLIDCNEIDQEDMRGRRRLADEDNEVEGCDGDFIRSFTLDSESDDCEASCEYAEDYTHTFSAGTEELVVLPVGSSITFDLSAFDADGDALLYEFGTLDGCNECNIEEGAEDNNEDAESYNRVIANQTSTTVNLLGPGYRCFAAKDPDSSTDACTTRTVVRVDPCYVATSTSIQLNDTTGDFSPDRGFYNLRMLLAEAGFENYTSVYSEEIMDILESLQNYTGPSTGIKELTVSVFQDAPDGDAANDPAEILAALTNTTALSEALGYEVVGASEVTPSPTPAPEESEEKGSSSSSSVGIIVGVAVAVVLLIGVAAYFFWPSSKETAHQPLKADGDGYGAA